MAVMKNTGCYGASLITHFPERYTQSLAMSVNDSDLIDIPAQITLNKTILYR
jgi:hypothetical protein